MSARLTHPVSSVLRNLRNSLLQTRHFSPNRHICLSRSITPLTFRTISSKHAIPALTTPSVSIPRTHARNYVDDRSDLAKPSAIQAATGSELVLSPPALVVTREYEWANILIGFEQANKYTIRAAPGGNIVGYLAEEESIGRTVTRNILRTRRPFKATVFDTDRNIIFTIRRPMFLVSSSVFVETPDGQVIGKVHMDWHVWRRRYSLYVDKNQFASVDSGFLAVDFDMRDEGGRKIASVNKDFTGFARELFTDARQYVLRLDPSYGLEHDGELIRDANTVNLAQEENSEMKMGQRERAVILAAAIAIDFDYFSLHSRGHMHPGLMVPMGGGGQPAPVPPTPSTGMGGAGTVVGADMMSDMAQESGAVGASDDPATPISDQEQLDQPEQEFFSGAGMDSNNSTEESEWATFEEPDHGFQQDPSADADTWSSDGDGWGGDTSGGDDGGEGGGGVIGTIMSILQGFSDSD
eukprot:GFKZ01008063.1.p1 GENE.GFKZ01008063.1~~GFKZ01008063.1.p1  ORF type:complete len:467 (+),score=60.27 GFKZ01008063.1:106-1506(+)